MTQSISPINLTAAALITQFSLAVLVFVAVQILQSGDLPTTGIRRGSTSSGLFRVTLASALVTIGFLVFSDEYSSTWSPLFGGSFSGGVPWSWAMTSVFILDIVWASILVGFTGGSPDSPFSPIYVLIPALAIFLREPLGHVVLYLLLVTVSFSVNFLTANEEGKARGGGHRHWAYWFVSVACFVLATFIGYVTRPQ